MTIPWLRRVHIVIFSFITDDRGELSELRDDCVQLEDLAPDILTELRIVAAQPPILRLRSIVHLFTVTRV